MQLPAAPKAPVQLYRAKCGEIHSGLIGRDWYVLCNTSICHVPNPLLSYSDVPLRMCKQARLTNHLISTCSDRSLPELHMAY
jgi:hypothetical protein